MLLAGHHLEGPKGHQVLARAEAQQRTGNGKGFAKNNR